jgi:uncharacterized integral membrane protein
VGFQRFFFGAFFLKCWNMLELYSKHYLNPKRNGKVIIIIISFIIFIFIFIFIYHYFKNGSYFSESFAAWLPRGPVLFARFSTWKVLEGPPKAVWLS